MAKLPAGNFLPDPSEEAANSGAGVQRLDVVAELPCVHEL